MRIATILGALSALILLAGPVELSAQAVGVVEPFKVGTFEIGGAPTVGLVFRDALVVDLNAANRLLELDPTYPEIPMPEDMLELIGRYEYGLKYRLYEIANYLVENGRLTGAMRTDFVHDVDDIRILPPIMYPRKVLNAAGNFYSHVGEGGGPEQQAAAARERAANRGVPYLFLKPTWGSIIGNGASSRFPSAVTGRTGKSRSGR